MADDFNILFQAKLDETKSISSINAQIDEIAKKLKELNIKFNIDSTEFKKVADSLEQMNKANSTNSFKQTSNQIKQQSLEVDNLTKKYGKLIKEVQNYNAQGSPTGSTLTFRDQNTGLETDVYYRAAEETSSRVTNNIEKLEKAALKTEVALKRLGDVKLTGLRDSDFEGTYVEAREKLEAYIRSVYGAETQISKLQRTYNSAGQEVWKFTTQVATGKDTFDQIKGSIDRTTTSLREQDIATNKTLNRNLGFLEQFKIALQRVPIWIGAMTIFWGSLRSAQSGVEYIRQIDTAMTDLRKVAEESTSVLREFSKTANQIGDGLAATTVDVINATASMAKLGYELDKANVLAQKSILYSNVGDLGIEDASGAIISTVKAFGIEVDEQGKNIENIVDIFNNVSNNMAISSAGIGEALKRSASALYAGGNTLEQATSLITAANASVQDVDVVGGFFLI